MLAALFFSSSGAGELKSTDGSTKAKPTPTAGHVISGNETTVPIFLSMHRNEEEEEINVTKFYVSMFVYQWRKIV